MSTTITTNTSTNRSTGTLAWAALVVVWLVWGSTYLAIRIGVRTMPPFTMAAIRYLLAGLILLPIGWRSGTPQQRLGDRPGVRQWAAAALLGAMLPAAGNGVVSWAEMRLPSGIAALLVGTVPLWMVLADAVVRRRMPGRAHWLALVIGLAGVAVLSGGGGRGFPIGAAIAVLLAAMSWGTGSVLQGRLPVPARPLLMAGMEMLCGGLVCAVISLARGDLTFNAAAVSGQSWWALVYLIGAGTLLAMTCYVFVLGGRLPASTVSSYAFVNPVVAVLLGAVILNERLTDRQALGAVIVVAAVVGLLTAPRRAAQGASSAATNRPHKGDELKRRGWYRRAAGQLQGRHHPGGHLHGSTRRNRTRFQGLSGRPAADIAQSIWPAGAAQETRCDPSVWRPSALRGGNQAREPVSPTGASADGGTPCYSGTRDIET